MAYLPLIPFVNATLTKVEGGGFSEDYDRDEGADTTKWSGSADAWLKQTSDVVEGGERSDELEHDRIQFAAADVNATAITLGDSVTYTHDGSPDTRKVREVERFDTVGIVRLTLRDA